MASPASRLLRLLALLQGGRLWSGADLAARLDLHPRNLRRDIERLRSLGYPVQSVSGSGGGYRLGQGAPGLPLLFDEQEALTIVMALRAAAPAIGGLEAPAARILGKLDPLLPRPGRQRASAAHAATASLPTQLPEALVAAERLAQLAAACRDGLALRLDYRRHSGERIARVLEPALLVNYGRRWYLLGWDCQRQDWRTLRVDRIDQAEPTGARFAPRPLPDEPLQLLRRAIGEAPFACRARVRLAGTLEALAARVPPWLGALEADGPDHCWLGLGAADVDGLAANLLLLGRPFLTLQPAALQAPLLGALDALRARLQQAGDATWQGADKLGHSAP
ncbi:helix-turn-helix transcriptional regulator [Xanthomonas maliensis]|uniref:helix-turn-helix transcriptional regulator n=1 Tax=Xanthomonas maliensis TaxID=1321368 RepID=UPI0004CEA195|nr:WYL domain-containing protein [Xanthomonas maliensis]KAB7764840.1 transcriptional regulator [Xanthomonas maliensis]